MSTNKKTATKQKTKASDMFFLAFLAYIPLWAEPAIKSFIFTSLIDTFPIGDLAWTLILRGSCIAIWIWSALGIRNASIKNCSYDVLEAGNEKPKPAQWGISAAIAAVFIAVWVIINLDLHAERFANLIVFTDYVYFTTEYIFFAFQAALIALIIAFAHKGCEICFGKSGKMKYIPWGGIIQGLLWGIVNYVTAIINYGTGAALSSLPYALAMIVMGVAYGAVHVIMGCRLRYSIPFIILMFILI